MDDFRELFDGSNPLFQLGSGITAEEKAEMITKAENLASGEYNKPTESSSKAGPTPEQMAELMAQLGAIDNNKSSFTPWVMPDQSAAARKQRIAERIAREGAAQPAFKNMDEFKKTKQKQSTGATSPNKYQAQKEKFIAENLEFAQQQAKRLNVPVNKLLAHAGHESAWGQKPTGEHNIFGIKAKRGTKKTTHEYEGGESVKQKTTFADYGSREEAWEAYGDLVSKPRYSGALEEGGNRYFEGLKAGGYATDPLYASKLNAIANAKTLRNLKGDTPPIEVAASTSGGISSKIIGGSALASMLRNVSKTTNEKVGAEKSGPDVTTNISDKSTPRPRITGNISQNIQNIQDSESKNETKKFQRSVVKLLTTISKAVGGDNLQSGKTIPSTGQSSGGGIMGLLMAGLLGGGAGALATTIAPFIVAGGAVTGAYAATKKQLTALGDPSQDKINQETGKAYKPKTAAMQIVDALGQSTIDSIRNVSKFAAETQENGLGGALTKTGTTIKRNLGEFDKYIMPRFKKGMSKANEELSDSMSKIDEYIMPKFKAGLKKSYDEMGVTDLTNTIEKKFNNGSKSLLDGITNTIKRMEDAGKKQSDALDKITSDGATKVKNSATELAGIIADAITGVIKTIYDAPGKAIDYVSEKASDVSKSISAAWKDGDKIATKEQEDSRTSFLSKISGKSNPLSSAISAPKVTSLTSSMIKPAFTNDVLNLTQAQQSLQNLEQKEKDSAANKAPIIIDNSSTNNTNSNGGGGDSIRLSPRNFETTKRTMDYISLNVGGAGRIIN